MNVDTSRGKLLVQLVLQEQREKITQFRIQGTSVTETHNDKSISNLECNESDNFEDSDSDLDDSVHDPTVTFNQKDIERSSSENEHYSDQDEVIKIKYMHIAHRTTDNDDDNTANEMGQGMVIIEEVDHEEVVTQETNASTWKKRAKRGKADKEELEKNRNKRQRMQGEKYLGLKKAQDGTYIIHIV